MKHSKLTKIVTTVLVSACMVLCLGGCATQDYAPQKKEATVNDSALGTAGTLRVGVNASSAPYAAQSSGKIVGLNVDIAAAIADEMGLSLEVVDIGSDAKGALEDEDVDMVMGVESKDTTSEIWKSESYLKSGIALFSSSPNAAAPSNSSKIGAQASSMSALAVSNMFGDSALVASSDLKSAFSSLDSRSVGYVAADAVIGSYVVNAGDFQATILSMMEDPIQYCVGVSRDNKDLQVAMRQAVNNFNDSGLLDVIERKWLGTTYSLDGLKKVEGTNTAATAPAADAAATDPAAATAAAADPAATTEAAAAATTDAAAATAAEAAAPATTEAPAAATAATAEEIAAAPAA